MAKKTPTVRAPRKKPTRDPLRVIQSKIADHVGWLKDERVRFAAATQKLAVSGQKISAFEAGIEELQKKEEGLIEAARAPTPDPSTTPPTETEGEEMTDGET